jgi:hypothetical protein
MWASGSCALFNNGQIGKAGGCLPALERSFVMIITMSELDFITATKKLLVIGRKFETPGGGINIIKNVSDIGFIYKKPPKKHSAKIGKPWSTIFAGYVDFYNTYIKFKGKICSTNDLKSYASHIFDSKLNGHSCNCTMFFILLKELELTDRILGKGVKGSPFYVNIK